MYGPFTPTSENVQPYDNVHINNPNQGPPLYVHSTGTLQYVRAPPEPEQNTGSDEIYDIRSPAQFRGISFSKYKKLDVILPKYRNHPAEIINGVAEFCAAYKMKTSVVENSENGKPSAGTAYVVTSETDLAKLIKRIRKTKLVIGKDIGILSYNETELKDLLDITTITTDFEAMGKTAANLILKKEYKQLINPFRMIRRGSL